MILYRTLHAVFFGHPWALAPEVFAELETRLRAGRLDDAAPALSAEACAAIFAGPRRGASITGNGVAVLPISGVIQHRASPLDEYFGAVSAEGVGVQLDQLAADRTVRKIVLQIDSPGGSVYGIQELAAKIRGARQEKKVVAIADPVAASAALWLGAQATEFYSIPSGQVGSIGVIASHADYSEADAKAGVKITHVTAGKFKAEGADTAPLSDEALAYMQTKVNAYYDRFVSDVATGRGVSEASVRNDFGQGRMLLAAEAKRVGLIDGVATLPQLIARLGGGGSGGTSAEGVGGDVVRTQARIVELGLR